MVITRTPTNVIQYNEYYPFGLNTESSWTRENVTGNNFQYNQSTELNVTTGYYDLFFRNFDPTLGRFMQVDPLASKYHNQSTYQYGNNDPVYWSDPSGAGGDERPGGARYRVIDEVRDRMFGSLSVSGYDGAVWTGGEGSGMSYTSFRGGSLSTHLIHLAADYAKRTGDYQSFARAYGETTYVSVPVFVPGRAPNSKDPGTPGKYEDVLQKTRGGFPLQLMTATFSETRGNCPTCPGSNYIAGLSPGFTIDPDSKLFTDISDPKNYPGIKIYETPLASGAVTLPGIGIFVYPGGGKDRGLLQHEYGHFLDSLFGTDLLLTPSIPNTTINFYLMIGLPSIFNAATGLGGDHGDYWTEIRANQRAESWFGSNLSPQFGPDSTYRFPTK